MKYLMLQAHVSFALVEGRAVFLDLRRDRYLALDPGLEAAFASLCSDPLSPLSREQADGLLATGLFAPAAAPGEFATVSVPQPADAATPAGGAPTKPWDVLEIWLLLLRSRRALCSRPLEAILDGQKAPSVAEGKIASAHARRLAGRFLRARTLVPVKPSCLQDSLALKAWLARRGAFPAIILGVKLSPFAAHCWIQEGQTVLNEAPDTVRAFTPLLARS